MRHKLVKIGMLGALLFTSIPFNAQQSVHAQDKRILTVGNSLTEEELQETKDVLGANDISEDLVLRVKGSDIDYYTKNGSTDDSIVVSSVLVEFKDPGYGVNVEILTPENITEVTGETYQNAAVTAGGKDLNIKIANVTFPVNGRGALAGIYLTMDLLGGGINLDDIALAEKELALLQDILERDSSINPETLNQLLATLKKDVVEDVKEGRTITQQRLDELIGMRLDDFEIDIQEDTREDLLSIILNFSKTEAAQDEDLIKTLDMMTGDLLKHSGEAIKELPDVLEVEGDKPKGKQIATAKPNTDLSAVVFILVGVGLAGVLFLRIQKSKKPKSKSTQTKRKPRKK